MYFVYKQMKWSS